MGFFSAFQGFSRVPIGRGAGCAGLLCLLCAAPAQTSRRTALSPWEQALQSREQFENEPVGTHTKATYTQVMDSFRAIYHQNPRDLHAAEAVNTVAELLAEQGRELSDETSLRNAVGQYEFLRTQYPASPLRARALFAEGKIEAEDLKDAALARDKWNAVIREAPKSKAAADARVELVDLGNTSATAASKPQPAKPEPAAQGLALTEANARAVEGTPTAPGTTAADEVAIAPVQRTAVKLARPGPLATVTGIRHWSTATYTRVAIDLGSEVTFEAARVPHPDRIYFDLHGARLGTELVGKSFSVTDDGFLKRIRAAQASPDVTRVVLDVNDVTDYSAFLLPNPYRLIIDIHGGRPAISTQTTAASAPPTIQEPVTPVSAGDSSRASAAANTSGLPAMALTDGGDQFRPAAEVAGKQNGRALPDMRPTAKPAAPNPGVARSQPAPIARPVPNTVTVKAPAAAVEVAAVSDAPGKITATSAPTSKPIAVGVPTGVPAATAVNLGSGTGRRKRTKPADLASADAAPAKAAEKTADGEISMIRALGLHINRIVIDAGHGGHDSGTLGADGIQEKDVVLDVALRLGRLLHDRLGAEIIYTRSDDTFIPLETRTAIANKAQADLFLSIHANSSQDESARGVETYYLNFTSDPTALDVAARENAVSGASVHQLSDLVKKITLKDKIEESREFANDVESSLYAGLFRGNDGLKNRGVKKAPFVVLIGANMPSILAEISFVTNPRDAAQLRRPEYRERVAESLYTGVAKYEDGLAGSRPPSQVARAVGR